MWQIVRVLAKNSRFSFDFRRQRFIDGLPIQVSLTATIVCGGGLCGVQTTYVVQCRSLCILCDLTPGGRVTLFVRRVTESFAPMFLVGAGLAGAGCEFGPMAQKLSWIGRFVSFEQSILDNGSK